jgi:copper(I)-binding protein
MLLAALLLTACGSPEQQRPMADAVAVHDAWAAATEHGMAAVFGTVVNDGADEVRVTSGSSPAAGIVEVHEVVGAAGAKTMRPKDGGLVIPGGGHHELVPGGDHLMLMDLTAPLHPGDEVTVTLIFQEGRRCGHRPAARLPRGRGGVSAEPSSWLS